MASSSESPESHPAWSPSFRQAVQADSAASSEAPHYLIASPKEYRRHRSRPSLSPVAKTKKKKKKTKEKNITISRNTRTNSGTVKNKTKKRFKSKISLASSPVVMILGLGVLVWLLFQLNQLWMDLPASSLEDEDSLLSFQQDDDRVEEAAQEALLSRPGSLVSMVWTTTTTADIKNDSDSLQTLLLTGTRAQRFPSIQQRIPWYMGSTWYHPPCNDNHVAVYECIAPPTRKPAAIEPATSASPKTNDTDENENEQDWQHLLTQNEQQQQPEQPKKAQQTGTPPPAWTVRLKQKTSPVVHSYSANIALGSTWWATVNRTMNCTNVSTTARLQQECWNVNRTFPRQSWKEPLPNETATRPHNRTTKPPPIFYALVYHPLPNAVPYFYHARSLWDVSTIRVMKSNNNNNKSDNTTAVESFIPFPTPPGKESMARVSKSSWYSIPKTMENDFNTTTKLPCPRTAKEQGPIVWPLHLDSRRLSILVNMVLDHDVFWGDKYDKALFRGNMMMRQQSKTKQNFTRSCYHNHRCRLVLLYHNSTRIDAKLTPSKVMPRKIWDLRGNIVDLVGTHVMSVAQQFRYKAFLWLEDNDDSSLMTSGYLKWTRWSRFILMMLSRSVIMMPHFPQPRWATWHLQEWMQPYVHYLPIYPNLTNVEQQFQWIVKHDLEAQQIANRSSLWMQDLLLGPEARRDNDQIAHEILDRYGRHFRAKASNKK
mmetsp:Transcript_8814/g.21514  ORF Transcript_8814/g.21514 Transcript_8814/m.21514 type:complete len:711 (-) Transcript_8814:112-2244(-)